MSEKELQELGNEMVAMFIPWEVTEAINLPLRAEVHGHECFIRVNDFPDEPLYTLLVDGEEVRDMDEWPVGWPRPSLALLSERLGW